MCVKNWYVLSAHYYSAYLESIHGAKLSFLVVLQSSSIQELARAVLVPNLRGFSFMHEQHTDST